MAGRHLLPHNRGTKQNAPFPVFVLGRFRDAALGSYCPLDFQKRQLFFRFSEILLASRNDLS